MTIKSSAPIGGTVGLIREEKPLLKVMMISNRMEMMMMIILTKVSSCALYTLHLKEGADGLRNGRFRSCGRIGRGRKAIEKAQETHEPKGTEIITAAV